MVYYTPRTAFDSLVRPPCVIHITSEFSILPTDQSIVPHYGQFVKPSNRAHYVGQKYGKSSASAHSYTP